VQAIGDEDARKTIQSVVVGALKSFWSGRRTDPLTYPDPLQKANSAQPRINEPLETDNPHALAKAKSASGKPILQEYREKLLLVGDEDLHFVDNEQNLSFNIIYPRITGRITKLNN